MSSSDNPKFFVPQAEDSLRTWEELRAVGADWLGRPLRDRKIYSLGFEHDGISYRAVVGESRRASKYREVRGKVDYSRSPMRYDDGPPVLAIFQANDEDAYLIFDTRQSSTWNWPQIVGGSDVDGAGQDFLTD